MRTLPRELKVKPLVSTGSTGDWRSYPLQTLQAATRITALSRTTLYAYGKTGRLSLKVMGGRTLVTTDSLVALVDNLEDWTPSARGGHRPASRAS